LKRRLKTWLGKGVYATGLHRLFFRNKALVVLFHRVDDRLAGNPITCTQAEFRAFCRFFRKYFKVISFGRLMEMLANGEDLSNCLVITFDDGYKDNRQLAAEELKRLDLPACFFVATNFIASDHVTWWDKDLPVGIPWMTWDDVRELHAMGFEIGSHTMNHVDLGVLEGEDARVEIVGSKERLAAELSMPVRWFSYPYGRLHQITEANREAVRRAGYECCISAYGGAVSPGTDAFRVKRVGISPWYLTPYQFGFEALFFQP